MALKGNLRDFSFSQLLNLISIAKKSGTLEINGPNKDAWLSFREGKLSYAHNDSTNVSLAAILFRNDKLNNKQYQIIQKRAGDIGDKELGLMLINANYLSQQEILSSLKTPTKYPFKLTWKTSSSRVPAGCRKWNGSKTKYQAWIWR